MIFYLSPCAQQQFKQRIVCGALGAASFPFLALIGLQGTSVAVVQRIEEPVSPNEFTTKLAQSIQRFGGAFREARREKSVICPFFEKNVFISATIGKEGKGRER